ncbi:hypothetical protein EE612_014907 [Oryza sativa]|nr:hypothetical protein EE612_014907 [Oryza sativa]
MEALLHLRVQLVVLEAEVVAGQRLERLEVAEREVDVHVQPPRPHHRRVHALLAAAHREHHHPLLATARRDAVHEAQHPRRPRLRVPGPAALEEPVEVLHEDEGPRGGVQEQRAEVVAAGAGEIDVVDVVAQEPSHGRREGRLAGARRAVEEVAPAPHPPEAVVVGAALEEVLEVGADASLEVGVHGHRVKRRRVGERRRRPPRRPGAPVHAGVGEQPQLASPELHLIGNGLDVLQVGPQHARPVMAAHAQNQHVAPVCPREARAEEGVARGVAWPKLQGEAAVGPRRGRQHGGGVGVLERRQRRHVLRRLAEQRVLGAAAVAREEWHLVVLVRLRPLVGPPPQPPHRVQRRLVRQRHPQRHHGQGGVGDGDDDAAAAHGTQQHGAAWAFGSE